jgi:hypothetical protein
MATKKELKVKHFQTPEDLCTFVNGSNITIYAIVPFDRFQAVYYYEK